MALAIAKLFTGAPRFAVLSAAIAGVAIMGCATGAGAQEVEPDDCAAWDVYNARPGHPTAEERADFVARARVAAERAEADHGVPAAALAAMAINESGYGFTRTGLYANNYFGFKYSGRGGVEGVDYYVLECQPPDDPGNRYIKFADMDAAFDAVAARLATSGYYRGDTAVYRQATENGQHVVDRVNIWLTGIANPYNGFPSSYVGKLVRLMNDPLRGADRINPETNLYSLSGEVGDDVEGGAGTSLAYRTALDYLAPRIANGGRYMEGDCRSFDAYLRSQLPAGLGPGETFNQLAELWRAKADGYRDYPVQLCSYTAASEEGEPSSMDAHVLLLNASAERLAHWVDTACRRIGRDDETGCAEAASRNIWSGNNAQFPVGGIVIEDEGSAGGSGPDLVNLEFRDGITIESSYRLPSGGGLHWTSEPVALEDVLEALETPIVETRRWARVAHAQREDYRASLGGEEVGVYSTASRTDPEAINFHKANREAYLAAWHGYSYPLLNGWAARRYAEE